jgi:hypothetical protein
MMRTKLLREEKPTQDKGKLVEQIAAGKIDRLEKQWAKTVRHSTVIICVFILLLYMTGCQPAGVTSPVSTTTISATHTIAAQPQIVLYYEENAQIELFSPQGARVLIDIGDPSALSSPPTSQDILLTTSPEGHRNNSSFEAAFPGRHLDRKAGPITLSDVTIQGITSKCKDTDEWGSNYIYRIDLGGLRIAAFGEIGQSALTADQIEALGAVDIAIMQLTNYDCDLDLSNRKAIHIMDQVQPKLMILTQSNWQAVGDAAQLWRGYATSQPRVVLGRSDLDGPMKMLVMGMMASAYQKLYNLADW